jgi:hypothetical protein
MKGFDMLPTSDQVIFFYNRTVSHIKRVSDNLLVLKPYALSLGIPEDDFESRRIFHDKSKFSEDEFIPYVWLTESKKQDSTFSLTDSMQSLINNAIKHHYENNRHHPEHFSNANEMSSLDLIEMVCDWTAIAQEIGNGDARQWAMGRIGSRWHFNMGKLKIIGRSLENLNKSRI